MFCVVNKIGNKKTALALRKYFEEKLRERDRRI